MMRPVGAVRAKRPTRRRKKPLRARPQEFDVNGSIAFLRREKGGFSANWVQQEGRAQWGDGSKWRGPRPDEPGFVEWVVHAADKHCRNGQLTGSPLAHRSPHLGHRSERRGAVNELRTFLRDSKGEQHPFVSWLTGFTHQLMR